MEIIYKPIGIAHTPFKDKAPYQYFVSDAVAKIEIFPEYEEGLEGIENFSMLLIIFHFHKSKDKPLKVKPRLYNEIRGVFATRSPARPNAIGVSEVKLIRRVGRILYVKGVDMLDGTPILDIKPKKE